MVELVVGRNGRGKTKYLLDYASREISTVSGSIAYLDKNKSHMYELNNKIRLIDVNHYGIRTNQEFIGFILGLLSQDHDLQLVFVDAFCSLAALDGKDISPTVQRLEEIGSAFHVKFVLSVGMDQADIPEALKENIAAAL